MAPRFSRIKYNANAQANLGTKSLIMRYILLFSMIFIVTGIIYHYYHYHYYYYIKVQGIKLNKCSSLWEQLEITQAKHGFYHGFLLF